MWMRERPALPADRLNCEEKWTDSCNRVSPFKLRVRYGKHLDVLRLKGFSRSESRDEAEELATSIRAFYAEGELETIDSCPACGDKLVIDAGYPFLIHAIEYVTCANCGHATVATRPKESAFNQRFTTSAELSAVYTDRAAGQARIDEIVAPKLEWVVDEYQQQYAVDPKSFVDVGAGGGHFVQACHDRGFGAAGYEISQQSRDFARQTLGVSLSAEDFLAAPRTPSEDDVITFWGLLEYVPRPVDFVMAARERLATDSGMLIVEVPRIDSLSSAIQRVFPHQVVRHLDPGSHINVFSDTSLIELLVRCGFRPVGTWYFGMDWFEFLCQVSMASDSDGVFSVADEILPSLQALTDRAQLCDDIVIAAVPI